MVIVAGKNWREIVDRIVGGDKNLDKIVDRIGRKK